MDIGVFMYSYILDWVFHKGEKPMSASICIMFKH